MSITGTFVYWAFTNVEFYWMLYDTFNSIIMIDEERVAENVTIQSFAASVLVTFVPMGLLITEYVLDQIIFPTNFFWSSAFCGFIFASIWLFQFITRDEIYEYEDLIW